MTFKRPPSTQQAVLAELRAQIGSGTLRPGERVPVEDLVRQFGISRIPIREALKILEGEGQLVNEAHRGSFVANLSLSDLRQLYRMRELLEADAIRLAVPRLDDDAISRISTSLADADVASERRDLTAYAAANRRFHFELFAASDAKLLTRAIEQFWNASDAYRALFANLDEHRRAAAEDHHRILAAVHRRDTEGVVEAQWAHRTRALDVLGRLLTE